MTVAQLFQNLHDHLPIEFAENLVNSLDTSQLWLLDFDESGTQIKDILESTYTDGVTGLENVKNDGKQITGIFLDKISPAIAKRYKFTISPSNISYQLENPGDLEGTDFAELEFAASKMFGGSKKPKNCPNSTPCGFSCIKKGLKCSKAPNAEQKQAIAQLLDKPATTKSRNTKPANKPDIPDADKEAIALKADSKTVASQRASAAKSKTSKKRDRLDLAASLKNRKLPASETKDADTSSSKKVYSIKSEKDFEDVAVSVFNKLHDKYGGLVPIYQIRNEIGENVPRNEFNDYMKKLQSKGILQLQGGSVEDSSRDKIEGSLTTELDGLRTYASIGDNATRESIKSQAESSKKKVEELTKSKKPLDDLGTAADLAAGAKIKSQKEFNDVITEAHHRLNYEFNHGDLVPIAKLRKALGDRISKEDFDTKMGDYLDSNPKANFGKNDRASAEEEKGGIKTELGGTQHYLQLGVNSKDAYKGIPSKK